MDEARGHPAEHDEELRVGLTALSQLATGQLELTDALTRIAQFAVLAIPGADGAGLLLLANEHFESTVSSAAFVAEMDRLQHDLGQGPGITAVRAARTVRSGSVDTDASWPALGRRAAHLGVYSALCLPLSTPAGVLGALSVYAFGRDAFTEHAACIAELFAVPAAIAVQNAQVLAQSKALAAQLQAALINRASIDHAIGILMARTGCGPDAALARLRGLSQSQNQKLYIVAAQLVEEAVRRARRTRR